MSRSARSSLLSALHNPLESIVQVDYAEIEMKIAAGLGLGKSLNFASMYGHGVGKSSYTQMTGRQARSLMESLSINVSVSLETGWMKLVVTDHDVSVNYGPKEGRRTFCAGSFTMSLHDAVFFARSLVPQNVSAIFLDSRSGQVESKTRRDGTKGKWLVRVRMINGGGDWTTVRGDPRKLMGFAMKLESVVSQKIAAEVMAT